MGTLLLWIFLFISLPAAYGLPSFPKNVVAAIKDDPNPVTLTCDVKSDVPVEWRFTSNGGEMEDIDWDTVQQVGPHLNVTEVDEPMLGEYSCLSGGKKLSSTYLLLRVPEEEVEDAGSAIRCWAQSYNCNFNCSWTLGKYTAVRLGLGHDCIEGKKSCDWVGSSDGGFQFELSHTLSPYAEESTMFEVTAEAINDQDFLKMTKRFYLRDIIQPDSPEIVRCQEDGEELNVTIDPPSSWSTPHSFFSLEHEIEYVNKDDGKTGHSLAPVIPKRISKLRVRSRDPLVPSAWSQWSPWKNVTH
ncbi:interleukin-12 subunit beta isoform X2 [Centroberyx affinis]|uniref:interleukin-12 subunit beta isoform X2 n=1 Tax=Centroberyx affinis TaxID=166261 RepID=UPI003A5C0115